MEYPDLWVFYYDQATLTSNFETSPFADYLTKGEPSMKNLKSITLSFNEYENEAQKILINQNQLLLTFFTTEANRNPNQYFQYFSSKIIKYVEAEILYQTSFWVYCSLPGFVRQRVNASLLRTLKFLTALQITVLQKYNRGIDLTNLSIMDPEQNSLMQNVDSLLVDYQHLNVFIIFFRKAYGGLLAKLQGKSSYYKLEANLVEKIFLFCKSFFTANPRGIWTIINKSVPETTEKDMLLSILRANEALKGEIYEESQKKPSQRSNYNSNESDILQHLSEDIFRRLLSETDEQSYSSIGSNSSPRRKRDRGFVKIIGNSNQDLITEYFRRNRGSKALERISETVVISLNSESQLKDETELKEQYSSGPKEEVKIPEYVETKGKEKKDLFAILANSPNNPLQMNKFLPLDARMPQELQFSRSPDDSEHEDSVKKELFVPNESSREDEEDSDMSSSSFEKMDDGEALDNFFKENFDEDFLKKMEEQNPEPDKLRGKNSRNSRMRQKQKSVVLQRRSKMKGNKKKGLQAKSLSAWYMLGTDSNENIVHGETEGIKPILKRQTTKEEIKKGRDISEHMHRGSKEHVPDAPGVLVIREDKGPDIPDEQLLGNLVGDDYISDEESNHSANIDNDDQDQEHDHEHENEHEKSDQKEKEENEEALVLWENKRELEHSQNNFIQEMLEMKAKKEILPRYKSISKNTVVLSIFSTLDKERKHNFWTNIKDTRKMRQIQTEILTSMEDEDPTYGLYYTMKTLEYFKRLRHRSRTALLDFECLND